MIGTNFETRYLKKGIGVVIRDEMWKYCQEQIELSGFVANELSTSLTLKHRESYP